MGYQSILIIDSRPSKSNDIRRAPNFNMLPLHRFKMKICRIAQNFRVFESAVTQFPFANRIDKGTISMYKQHALLTRETEYD